MYLNELTEKIPETVKTKVGVNQKMKTFSNKQSAEAPFQSVQPTQRDNYSAMLDQRVRYEFYFVICCYIVFSQFLPK
jgi:hypothetical protein